MTKTTIVDIHKENGVRPDYDVYCGRAVQYTEFTHNSKWCNRFYVKRYQNPEDCLKDFERDIRQKIKEEPVKYDLKELVGKRLGCWCITTDQIYPMRCHCQVYLKLIREKGLE